MVCCDFLCRRHRQTCLAGAGPSRRTLTGPPQELSPYWEAPLWCVVLGKRCCDPGVSASRTRATLSHWCGALCQRSRKRAGGGHPAQCRRVGVHRPLQRVHLSAGPPEAPEGTAPGPQRPDPDLSPHTAGLRGAFAPCTNGGAFKYILRSLLNETSVHVRFPK